MWPLAGLAVYMYWLGFEMCLRMRRWNKICASDALFEAAYADFVSQLKQVRQEEDNVSGALKGAGDEAKEHFCALRRRLMSGTERRLSVLKILSGVAPLIGLLGTVCGMTISISSAAFDSSEVAAGISSALVTTQAGLVVAIPAWIIAMFASWQIQKLLINLARREAALITGENV